MIQVRARIAATLERKGEQTLRGRTVNWQGGNSNMWWLSLQSVMQINGLILVHMLPNQANNTGG